MTPSEWATTFEWSKQHPYQVGDIVTMHVPWKQWSLWERLAYRLTHGLRSTPERVDTLRVMASGTTEFLHEGEPYGGEYLLPLPPTE